MSVKTIIKDLLPPIITRWISSLPGANYGWFGDYPSWQLAKNDASGYDSEAIAEKVKDAVLKVKEGTAVYERDSVLFDEIQYSWPLLAGLLWVAAQNKGQLVVADFGGSLGSTFFQNHAFFKALPHVKWCIVEQELFVRYGKKYIQDDVVRFYGKLDDCLAAERPQVVLFSSTLQYMEFPYEVLKRTFLSNPDYIIIDKMPFLEGKSRITLQKVPPEIYKASYPCWLLNRSEFLASFEPAFERIADFNSELEIKVDGHRVPYEGFLFQRRKST